MRAAPLKEAATPLVVRDDVEIAAPRAGQVRVRVTHCGVCHSDLSLADGVFPCPTPIILGHEAAGVVDAVGPDVEAPAPGAHVVLTPLPPCGTCYFCVRGEPGVCVNAAAIQTNTFPDGTTGLTRAGATVFRGVGLGAFGGVVLTPATGGGGRDSRRRAARGGVCHRLRRPDRRGRGAEHRPGGGGRHRPRARPRRRGSLDRAGGARGRRGAHHRRRPGGGAALGGPTLRG